jgi:hypothetical protein
MKKTSFVVAIVASALLAGAACSKKKDAMAPMAGSGSGEMMAGSGSGEMMGSGMGSSMGSAMGSGSGGW